MRLAGLVLSCLVVSGCHLGGNTGAGGGLLPGDDDEFVSAHNAAGDRVEPAPPTPIPSVVWSDTVAATAQAYADKCTWEHNADRGNLGENLFANSGEGFSPTQVVVGWEKEKVDYDYATNVCASGKICGHYTQVVWAASVEIGCGMKVCDVNSPLKNFPRWQLWVCDYAPPGNFNGQRPY